MKSEQKKIPYAVQYNENTHDFLSRTAIKYGADAVYIGGPSLGLRANAINFSLYTFLWALSCASRNDREHLVHLCSSQTAFCQESCECLQIEAYSYA